jgi:hypothetical protein
MKNDNLPRPGDWHAEVNMEQVEQVRGQGGFLAWIVRLLHSRRAVWRFGLLAVAGWVQFFAFLSLAMVLAAFQVIIFHREQPSRPQVLSILALSVVVALAATIHIYRTQKATFFDPPKERIPRKRWRRSANGLAAIIALAVAYTTWWLWLFLLLALVFVGKFVISWPAGTSTVLLYLTIPVPLLLALWAFVDWRHQHLKVLETAQPPELRLAANVVKYADEFQERAKALEKAMEEATTISKQVQHGIELEKQQLGELREQYLREAHLRDLTPEQVSAVRFALAEEQARSTRWGLWVNIVIAIVSWAAGVVTQALIDMDTVGNQLRQWFNLG